MWWRLNQDADLGIRWFYLLPQAHKICNYTMDWFPLKKTWKRAKRFLNKGLKDTTKMGRRVRGAASPKISPLAQQPGDARDLTNVELLPESWGLCPVSGIPNLTTCTAEMSSQYFRLWKPRGRGFRRCKRLKELKSSLIQRNAHQDSAQTQQCGKLLDHIRRGSIS